MHTHFLLAAINNEYYAMHSQYNNGTPKYIHVRTWHSSLNDSRAAACLFGVLIYAFSAVPMSLYITTRWNDITLIVPLSLNCNFDRVVVIIC